MANPPTSAPRRRWSLADWLVIAVMAAGVAALTWWLIPRPATPPPVVHEFVAAAPTVVLPEPPPVAAPPTVTVEPPPVPEVVPPPVAAPSPPPVATPAPSPVVQHLTFTIPDQPLAKSIPHPTFVEDPAPAPCVFRARPVGDAGFSGKVVDVPAGLMAEVEVGVLTMAGAYWVDGSRWRWQRVEPDGSFAIEPRESSSGKQARVIAARAPGHPISYFRMEFPASSGASDIELPLERGIPCTVSASVGGAPVSGFLQVEPLTYRKRDDGRTLSFVGLGLQRTDRAREAPLTVILPPRPVALFVRAKGAGPSWFTVDPRAGTDIHLAVVPEVTLTLTVTRGGVAQGGVDFSSMNNAVLFSYAGGTTDADGRLVLSGLAPGFYGGWIKDRTRVLAVGRGGPVELTWDLDAAKP